MPPATDSIKINRPGYNIRTDSIKIFLETGPGGGSELLNQIYVIEPPGRMIDFSKKIMTVKMPVRTWTFKLQNYKALVRYKNLAALALALSWRICARARAQNVLSAAHFCAHFKVPWSFQST